MEHCHASLEHIKPAEKQCHKIDELRRLLLECVASEVGQSRTSSFQRRGKASGAPGGGPRLLSIAGTRPSVRNGQLLVSTGLPALDQLLGRFRIKMWGHSRENLGWDSRSTHTHFLFPFPLHKHGQDSLF